MGLDVGVNVEVDPEVDPAVGAKVGAEVKLAVDTAVEASFMAFADVLLTLFAIFVVAFLFLTDVEGAADAADDTGAKPTVAAADFTTSCKLMRPVP